MTRIEAARLLTLRTTCTRDKEENGESMRQVSMAKLLATKFDQHVMDEAVRIHGGYGLIRGARVQCVFRTVGALRIYEGTPEI